MRDSFVAADNLGGARANMSTGLVALTGGTGFIGRRLLRALPKRGYELRVLVRSATALPLECKSAVIGDLARPLNLAAALEGVDAVVHSAGPSFAMSGLPELDHRSLSAEATVMLARAAQRAGVRRFIFLSSIAAQCSYRADVTLTEEMEPRPDEAYGLSKLAAERGLAELDMDWVALRPVLVYGPGMKGNMARLLRIARSPIPLPFARLEARRSLLSLENLVDAIHTVLTTPAKLRRPFIVADSATLTVPDMITAIRFGLGRRPGLFPVPVWALKAALTAAGREKEFRLLTEPLVADASALRTLGWEPGISTKAGLAELAKLVPSTSSM
jgi:UDP-glucose 4-epimerase